MIRTILTDIAASNLIALVCLVVWIYSVSMGYLPPLSGTAALQLEFAKYSVVGEDMMFDRLKD